MIINYEIPKLIEIPSTQVLTLHSTPVTIIPAPGLEKAIVLDEILLYKPAGTAYDSSGCSYMRLRYASSTVLVSMSPSGFLNAATAETRVFEPMYVTNLEILPNTAVEMIFSGAVLYGDSPLYVLAKYHILPTVL